MTTGVAGDLERGTDETFECVCTLCTGNNKTTEAEKFCCECQAYYCHSCVTFHVHIPNLKGHKIIDKSKSGLSQSFPVVPTDTCEQHGHKLVDMYCKQHDTVGCSSCMAVDHKTCGDTFYVPEYIKTNSEACKPKDLSTKLSAIASSLKTLEELISTQRRQLENSKLKSLKQIEKFRKEINQQLDKLVKKTITELELKLQFPLDQIEDTFRELQALATEVECTQDSLRSTSVNESQLFVSMKRASKIVVNTSEKINTLKKDIPVSDAEISFSENQQLSCLLKEIETLGTSSVTFTCPVLPLSHISSALQLTHPKVRTWSRERNPHLSAPKYLEGDNDAPGQQTLSLLKIKVKRTYPVNVKSDRYTCSILGACALEDGTVILSDYRNNKLKRLDSSTYTVGDCCDVPNNPWQVCVVSQQEVAVACTSASSLIQFVSVGIPMQTIGQINTDHFCYGLAYASGKLFVADGTFVYVYSVTGDRQQQFSKDQSGQSLFSYVYSLAVSRDNSKIYVADGDKGLIILDMNGKLIRQFNSPELQEARGLCLCMDDCFLVCGEKSKNVLQFTADGELVGQVLKTDKPCISICWNNFKLTVGYHHNKIDCHETLS